MNIISECCCDGVREGVDGAPATGFEGFRVLMWAVTCSILHLIRSMARLRFLSASDRGRPGSLAAGAVVPGPACPLSAMWGTEKEPGSWAVVSPGSSRGPDPVRARASGRWSVWCFLGGGWSGREVGLGCVGAGMRCGVWGAGRSRDRPGVRAGGRGGRIVRSCGAGGRGPGRRTAEGAPRPRR